jgi:hypothetical protein
MLFKPKFFLDLGAESQQQPTPVAPIVAPPAATAEPSQTATVRSEAVSAPPTAAAAGPAIAERPASLTTAEAIAAELAAAQANRPAPSLATFAPACVTPGGALPRRRRRGGADLAGFRELAKGMLRS